MSIVAVHGPQTFGSRGIQEVGSVVATVDPTNGLKWDFRLDYGTTRSNPDFSWAFPTDGTPTPQLLADPAVVTYATPGSKTATLTVTNTAKTVSNKALTSNVATITTTAAHGFIPGQVVTIAGVDATFNGTYTLITASGTTMTFAKVAADVASTASGGTATSASSQYPPAGSYPMTITAVSGAAPQLLMAPGGEPPPEGPFDPADHTVNEVEDYVTANPDQAQAVYDAEVEGKARVTLITWLEDFEA